MKGKLYDRLNELAWAMRNRAEDRPKAAENISEANGRELPVKDLWRWVKQMFKSWQHQEDVDELRQRLKEAETFKERVHKALDISDTQQLEAVLNGM